MMWFYIHYISNGQTIKCETGQPLNHDISSYPISRIKQKIDRENSLRYFVICVWIETYGDLIQIKIITLQGI